MVAAVTSSGSSAPLRPALRPASRADTGSSRVSFGRIQQLRAHEYVAEQIRRHIALRLLSGGEALPPERELATMFGVGRPTVQMALRLLEADGLIEARRGRSGGTFVLGRADDRSEAGSDLAVRLLVRRDQVAELLVYRRAVEPAVARLAAETRTPNDIHTMKAALEAMTASTTEPEYMRHDTEFHVAVARATHNRYLTGSIEQIRVDINDALSLLPESETWHRRINGEHEAIFQAICDGNAAAAEAASAFHVKASDTGIRALMASIGRRKPR